MSDEATKLKEAMLVTVVKDTNEIKIGISEIKGSIYDRWGHVVFTWNGLNNGWDGTINGNKAPIGIYAFRIDGLDTNKKKILEFGSVMLIH
jgi:gliding motility-associated-like protein